MDLGRIDENQLLNWLSWYDEVGVEDCFDNDSVNWFDRSDAQFTRAKTQKTPTGKTQITLTERSLKAQKSDRTKARVAEQTAVLSRQTGQATTLEALYDTMKQFDGWSLSKTARHFHTGIGPTETPDWLIFSEAPGETEERGGTAFSGIEAVLLRNYMKAAKIPEEQTRLSYALPYRPPGDQASHQEWFEMIAPFLHKQISLMQPKAMICFSTKTAIQLLRTDPNVSSSELRRKKQFYEFEKTLDKTELPDIPLLVLPTLKELLEVPSKKKQVWKETLRFKSSFEK